MNHPYQLLPTLFQGGYYNRLFLALNSQLTNEIEWALTSLSLASLTNHHLLLSIPNLIETLVNTFIKPLLTNPLDPSGPRSALQALRNFSFHPKNAHFLACAHDFAKLIFTLFTSDSILLPIKIDCLDIFENLVPFITDQQFIRTDVVPTLVMYITSTHDRAYLIASLNMLGILTASKLYHHQTLAECLNQNMTSQLANLLTMYKSDLGLVDRVLELVYHMTNHAGDLCDHVVLELPTQTANTLVSIILEYTPKVVSECPCFNEESLSSQHGQLMKLFDTQIQVLTDQATGNPTTTTAKHIIHVPNPSTLDQLEPLRALQWANTFVIPVSGGILDMDRVYSSYLEFAKSTHALILPVHDQSTVNHQGSLYTKDELLTFIQKLVFHTKLVLNETTNQLYVSGIKLRPALDAASNTPVGMTGSRYRTIASPDLCLWNRCTYTGSQMAEHVQSTHFKEEYHLRTCPWGDCSVRDLDTEQVLQAHVLTHLPTGSIDGLVVDQHDLGQGFACTKNRTADQLVKIKKETVLDAVGAPFTACLVLRNLIRGSRRLVNQNQLSGGPELLGMFSGSALVLDLVHVMASCPRIARFVSEIMDEIWEFEFDQVGEQASNEIGQPLA